MNKTFNTPERVSEELLDDKEFKKLLEQYVSGDISEQKFIGWLDHFIVMTETNIKGRE